MEVQEDFYDEVVKLCLEHFENLPKSGKPNVAEWTVLSCIVMESKGHCLRVVASGTGSKCIGKTKMSRTGDVLNDSHAEVICRRSFLRFIYHQMETDKSILDFHEVTKKFSMKRDIKFHFFTTRAPCGDAAIFPKQKAKDFGNKADDFGNKAEDFGNKAEDFGDIADDFGDIADDFGNKAEDFGNKAEDFGNKAEDFGNKAEDFGNKAEDFGDIVEDSAEAVPCKKIRPNDDDVFRTGAKCLEEDQLRDSKLPGSGYHVLGAVRTKPGRGDPTLSVSCSDKLARWCHLGVQGALLSLLLEQPIYLSSFVVTGDTMFSEKSLERALHGRIGEVRLNPPYIQTKINVFQCSEKFEFSQRDGKRASPGSMSWCDVTEKSFEVAVDGKRQGITKKKANTEVARLRICKLELFKTFLGVCEQKNVSLTKDCDNSSLTYESVKNSAEDYQKAWHVLRKSFKIWTRKDKNLIKFSIK